MTTRMLIDARHPEETRVAVLKGNRIEEFDFDSADHKQIKGNIYLAKVTRVEPSLQAAFVDFGGNRHGFLAFSEIHPDYYQIPKEDREALLAEEAAHAAEEAALRAAEENEDDDYDAANPAGDDGDYGDDYGHDGHDDMGGVTEIDTSEKDDVATIEGGFSDDDHGDDDDGHHHEDDHRAGEHGHMGQHEDGGEHENGEDSRQRGRGRGRGRRQGRAQAKDVREQAEDLRNRRMALRRRYKIQDVIQRRQVLLVQVVKEERGNKGAALTTYLSLAGRYCVLMPNSSHGGGISRKISSVADRKRLKSIVSEMQLPKSMGCIVRTAGLQRTKTEIKRDFDYLARLWDEIRETTLKSSAPALIHSDSDLIKRAIRDIYNRDILDVVVEGEEGYRDARDFMKLLMPSHARRVKAYVDPVPLFQRYGAEDQLTAMYDPVVQLKSGGYIVINPTEALVSIDINSGRSTKEHGIEATALNTNLEAAREIARQLRLRDMAGLVVIDFIDMEYGQNVRKVEKAMKDALKNDRARIQVGRISSFGLMEMSRQRLRTGVLEATTRACPHCDGSGLVRTAGSAGLAALRLIEDEAAKGKGTVISLFASQEASIYVLNSKRADLAEIEHRYGVRVEVIPEGENEGAKMSVASSGPRNEFVPLFEPIVELADDDDLIDEDYEDEDEGEEENARESGGGREGGREGGQAARDENREETGEGRRKRRKRRRGRGRREDGEAGGEAGEEGAEGEDAAGEGDDGDERGEGEEAERGEGAESEAGAGEPGESEASRKRRRRSRRRRGGRNREDGTGQQGDDNEAAGDEDGDDAAEAPVAEVTVAEAPVEAEPVAEEAAPKPKRSRRKPAAEAPEAVVEAVEAAPVEAEPVAEAEALAKPKRTHRKKADAVEAEAVAAEAPVEAAPVEAAVSEEAPAEKPKRVRRKKTDAIAHSDAAPVSDSVAEAAEPVVAADEAEPAPGTEPQSEADTGPRRTGWWQRTFGN